MIKSREFDSNEWLNVPDTALHQLLAEGWFSPGTSKLRLRPQNKTDRYDIFELLLKVRLKPHKTSQIRLFILRKNCISWPLIS